MTRESLNDWASRHVKVIVFLVTVGITLGVLRAEVTQKADRVEVDAIRTEMARDLETIRQTTNRVDEQTRQTAVRLEQFVCAERPTTLGCR